MATLVQRPSIIGVLLARPSRELPLLAVAILVVGLLIYHSGPLCPDVSGQLWIARAMRHGSRLYTDIIEVNPPLWFWMALPIDWVADALGLRTEPVVIVATGAAAFAAMSAVAQLIKSDNSRRPILFLVYMAGILLLMPARDVEQREHLVLIGAVPYLALAAARRQGRSISPLLALLIGSGAGLGFALKPYFLIVPVLIELWLLTSMRRDWRPLRVETLALAGVGGVYAAAVLTVTPDYLGYVIPLLLPAYQDTGATFRQTINILPFIWLAMLYPIVNRASAIRSGAAPLTVAFLIGAAGFALAWSLQHKGWWYQGIPTTGCVALALAACVLELGWPTEFRVRIFAPALILWPLSFALAQSEPPMTDKNDIAPALSTLREGDAFGLISTSGATSWPATIDRGLRMSSRYGQYWMLNAIDARPHDVALQRLGRQIVRDTALDYRCLPPKIIVFIRFERAKPNATAVDDPYRFFMRDPGFAEVMGHYQLSKVGRIYDAYRQSSPLKPVNRAICRRSG